MKRHQRFKIYNGCDEHGQPKLEGIATLKHPTPGRIKNRWEVEFDDEPGTTFTRFVQEANRIIDEKSPPGDPPTYDEVSDWVAGSNDEVFAALERSTFGTEDVGYCVRCGEEAHSVEPDLADGACESCGERAVYGAQQLLFYV